MVMDTTKCHAGGLDISEACSASGVCQHHGAQYAEFASAINAAEEFIFRTSFADNATIVQVAITTTKRCCIVVNAGLISISAAATWMYEIERPLATIRTTQEQTQSLGTPQFMHYAAWEVLAAGTYTYYLVNRAGGAKDLSGAWIKAVASDCEG